MDGQRKIWKGAEALAALVILGVGGFAAGRVYGGCSVGCWAPGPVPYVYSKSAGRTFRVPSNRYVYANADAPAPSLPICVNNTLRQTDYWNGGSSKCSAGGSYTLLEHAPMPEGSPDGTYIEYFCDSCS